EKIEVGSQSPLGRVAGVKLGKKTPVMEVDLFK
ncbi:unnamed protein product, partial [marine sediment metagenome]